MNILFALIKVDYVINMAATSFFFVQNAYATELPVLHGSVYRSHLQEVMLVMVILLNGTFSFLVEIRIC
jgi:hypothetical protein